MCFALYGIEFSKENKYFVFFMVNKTSRSFWQSSREGSSKYDWTRIFSALNILHVKHSVANVSIQKQQHALANEKRTLASDVAQKKLCIHKEISSNNKCLMKRELDRKIV